MKKRALVLALALILPLALYGIPYAYATTTSSSYVNRADGTTDAVVSCNSGDYATGGGATGFSYLVPPYINRPTHNGFEATAGQMPNGWEGAVQAGNFVRVYVVCQTPITVAGIGVPQFGSLYVAIALGAVVYFLMSRRFTGRPTVSAQVKA